MTSMTNDLLKESVKIERRKPKGRKPTPCNLAERNALGASINLLTNALECLGAARSAQRKIGMIRPMYEVRRIKDDILEMRDILHSGWRK